MTVSNPATLTSIKSEFNGPNDFKAYYRGGPYVPISMPNQISTTQNGLAISQFSGVSNDPPIGPSPNQPPSSYVSWFGSFAKNGSSATGLSLRNDNTWALFGTAKPTLTGQILTGVTDLSGYQVRMTRSNFNVSPEPTMGGATESFEWKAFPSGFTVTAGFMGHGDSNTAQATFTYSIRNASTGEIVLTRSIHLLATATSLA